MKPASLSARVTVLLAVVCLLVLGGGAKLMDWRIDHELANRSRRSLLEQARELGDMLAREQPAPPPHGAASPAGDGTWYELRCQGYPPQRSDPPPPAVPRGWPDDVDARPRYARLAHHLETVRLELARSGGAPSAGCRLLFVQDRHSLDELMLAIDWILALGPLLAAAVALIAVPLVVHRGLRPMGALVERMRGIGPHAPGQRLAPIGLRELDPLVARFNDVLARMDEGLARERQFASGLAHETRTRLAELRVLAEVEARYPSGRSLPDLLAEIGSIGAELEATVTALLLLTRLESGLEQPQWQSLATAPWIERQLQRQQPSAAARGIALAMEGTPPAALRTDPALLEVIVGNLLGNACAYAPAGDTVRLSVDARGLAIDNAAPGLADADLVRFGTRFWRKQLPHANHAGLGLALANAAARALGIALDFRLDPQQRLHASLDWQAAATPENPTP
ncbi:MAG: hypothetical protein RSP_08550 [Rhodanobacter sp.]